jgi:hypothetical protein
LRQFVFPSFIYGENSMVILQHTASASLSLEETLTVLSVSPLVDGIALFGSRAGAHDNPISDYDLLLLVTELPVPIFQMFTHIGGRMADLVFADTVSTDHALTLNEPIRANTFDALLLQKIRTAHIVYDASGRLERLQQHTQHREDDLFLPVSENTLYDACFWLNHALYHMKRMAQSHDPAYLMAVDMMLTTSLSSLWRAYYQVRDLRWEGEKAAVRHWQVHDPDYLQALRECIAEPDRQKKLAQYEALLQQTLAPVTPLWQGEVSAVYLRNISHTEANLRAALEFWEGLFK